MNMTRPDLDRFIAGWRGPLMAALIAFAAGLPGLLLLPAILTLWRGAMEGGFNALKRHFARR
ncbi:MAG: hypothetical protein EBX56_07800 [Betaproteobacteria bacterium]|nr:hypothetical protein [Betaproteobacteria bacterium]